MLLDGDPVPLKQPIEQHLDNSDFKDGVLALVEVDLTKIAGKSTRINISLLERFLKQIDEYTKQHGGNCSGVLVDAVLNFMAEHHAKNTG